MNFDEIWDDSALIEAWDASIDAYKRSIKGVPQVPLPEDEPEEEKEDGEYETEAQEECEFDEAGEADNQEIYQSADDDLSALLASYYNAGYQMGLYEARRRKRASLEMFQKEAARKEIKR